VSTRLGYLGLGSNLGDRRGLLQAAVEDLWTHGVQAIASSSVYETEPVGEVLDQPAFLNACLRIETALGPEALLDACKAVERTFGRAAGGVRHGPRPVDVDVLLLGNEAYESERLAIPHRELARRRFVLVPLLELAPDLVVPGGGGRAADALAALGQEGDVRRAGPPLAVDEDAARP
jgi:2-amino-4-hydroxy-6-hydroxymethyldihydropteridine diphosphokinase